MVNLLGNSEANILGSVLTPLTLACQTSLSQNSTTKDELIGNISTEGLKTIRQTAMKLDKKEFSQFQVSDVPMDSTLGVQLCKHPHELSNKIYVVTHETGEHFDRPVISYLKIHKAEPECAATLEKLVWKVSKILNFKEHFTPTKIVKIPLIENDCIYNASMQPELVGEPLGQYVARSDYSLSCVSTHELAMATLASIVFGMFDAHKDNIFITSCGRIRFFDNIQSLPNSNSFIAWLYIWNITSSYRCALLDLDRAREFLPEEVVEALLEKAVDCRDRLDAVSEYLNTYHDDPAKQSRYVKLPESWLKVDSVMAAMRKRLDLAIDTLTSGKQIQLVELACRSNPKYALAYGIHFLASMSNPRFKDTSDADHIIRFHRCHTLLNSCYTSKNLVDLIKNGYDLSHLISLSNETPKFDLFGERLVQYHREIKNKKLPKLLPKCREAIASIREGIEPDMKEAAYEYLVCNDILSNNLEILRKLGIPSLMLPPGPKELLDVPHNEFIYTELGTSSTILAYKTERFMKFIRLILTSKAGVFNIIGTVRQGTNYELTREGIERAKQLV